jgi:Mor family transcriptional regulator
MTLKHRATKSDRNRKLMALFETGHTIPALMAKFGLSKNRVMAILRDERNRRAASTDPFYRNLRAANQSAY